MAIGTLLALVCASCSKSGAGDAVTGAWVGTPPISKEMKADPSMKPLLEIVEDSYTLVLNEDHTYRLECWAEKKGTWKLSNLLIRFEETSSESTFGELFTGAFELGAENSAGKRTYSAVLSPDKKTLSLLMGKLGEVTFHR